MKKIFVVFINVFCYYGIEELMGFWLGEVMEFVEEVIKVGFLVDYVSF